VHLQYLGHPIANDPIYNDVAAWGDKGGKGGLFGDNSDFRTSSVEHDTSVSKLVDTLAASMHDIGRDSVDIHSSKTSDGAESPLEPPNPVDELGASEKQSRVGKGKDPCDDIRARFPEFNSRKGASLLIDDELKGGSEVGLVPQAVQAILHLRKLRDREDNYARYRDMERPVMPRKDIFKPASTTTTATIADLSASSSSHGTTTTSSISAKKGVRIIKKEMQCRKKLEVLNLLDYRRRIRNITFRKMIKGRIVTFVGHPCCLILSLNNYPFGYMLYVIVRVFPSAVEYER
jgi:hypothetical protein